MGGRAPQSALPACCTVSECKLSMLFAVMHFVLLCVAAESAARAPGTAALIAQGERWP